MRERRSFPRAKVFKGAKIILAGHPPVCCVVRDLSAQGAGLQFSSSADIPAEFDLTFDTGRRLRQCRVAWRSLSNAGVSFAPQA
jgi:hypothetical protein